MPLRHALLGLGLSAAAQAQPDEHYAEAVPATTRQIEAMVSDKYISTKGSSGKSASTLHGAAFCAGGRYVLHVESFLIDGRWKAEGDALCWSIDKDKPMVCQRVFTKGSSVYFETPPPQHRLLAEMEVSDAQSLCK